MLAKDQLGRRGEATAAVFLERAGLKIVDRNWRCPAGEIDLVAIDGSTLVIVEVKTRSSDNFGQPLEAITAGKLERLYVLASKWARAHNLRFSGFRIDAVGVLDDGSGAPRVEHVRAVV
ncbi:YraN family protein [Arthrobacter sp. NamB2]|uniref:YraN family protein n=1 Tax=Arthrobacter sp. NamB2 TaxID=2576035 RepID=UPI0010C9E77C|nr:YraN family protein [Arthrobacter sp. NamB2]TKV29921.1 YraN family protein [Arthrobacter sp. NamB2]